MLLRLTLYSLERTPAIRRLLGVAGVFSGGIKSLPYQQQSGIQVWTGVVIKILYNFKWNCKCIAKISYKWRDILKFTMKGMLKTCLNILKWWNYQHTKINYHNQSITQYINAIWNWFYSKKEIIAGFSPSYFRWVPS